MKGNHKLIESLNKFTQVKKIDVISVETPHIQKASDVQQADISVNTAINLVISVVYVSRRNMNLDTKQVQGNQKLIN